MVAGRGLAVELFVAAAGQGDEAFAIPDFPPGPMHGIKVHGHDQAAQVRRYFPQYPAQGEGGILAHAPGRTQEQEAGQVGVRGQGAQGADHGGEALGRCLFLQTAMGPLVIIDFQPSRLPACG